MLQDYQKILLECEKDFSFDKYMEVNLEEIQKIFETIANKQKDKAEQQLLKCTKGHYL